MEEFPPNTATRQIQLKRSTFLMSSPVGSEERAIVRNFPEGTVLSNLRKYGGSIPRVMGDTDPQEDGIRYTVHLFRDDVIGRLSISNLLGGSRRRKNRKAKKTRRNRH